MDLHVADMITIDAVALEIKAVLFYLKVSPLYTVLNVRNLEQSVRIMAECLLRDKIGCTFSKDVFQNKKVFQRQIEVCIFVLFSNGL